MKRVYVHLMTVGVLVATPLFTGCGPAPAPSEAVSTEAQFEAEVDEYESAMESGEYNPEGEGESGAPSE